MANIYSSFSEVINPFPIPILIFNEIYIKFTKIDFQIYNKSAPKSRNITFTRL